MANRLASILQQEYKTKGLVGGTASAVGKAAKEKLDIRNALFSGEGIGSVIGTKIFGKGYSATKREKTGTQKSTSPESLSSALSSGESPVLQEMNANMKLTAKNSMSLPMMARDMNLMKLNIFKLVKSFGDKPNTNKTDMFYEKSKIRNAAYNNTIGKMMGKGKLGTLAKGVFVGKKERDGQTPETALYINSGTGAAGGEDGGSVVGDILSFLVLKKILTATLGFLTGPVGLTILGGFGLFKVMENLMEKNSDKEGVDLTTKALGGGLDESQIGSEIMKAAEEGQAQRAAEELKRRTVSGPLEKLPQVLPDTGAGGGRGFVNPESVTPSPSPSVAPSNAVTSSSGSPIGTGTPGVYVTSGSAPSTSPTATIGSVPGLPIDYESYAKKIGEKESGGKYDEVNTLGYLGKYQFGAMALEDMGLVKKGVGEKGLKALNNSENWNIAGGKQAFLNNPQLQEDTMKRYTMQNFKSLNRLGVVNKNTPPEQIAGYLASSHLLGPGGALKLSQGISGSDAYGTSASSYYKVGVSTQMPSTTTASAPSVTSPPKSTGSAIASASTSVSDQKMAAMIPTGGQTTVVNGGPITVGSSKSGSRVSPFQKEFHDKIISAIALT
jgi:hypothetical protein